MFLLLKIAQPQEELWYLWMAHLEGPAEEFESYLQSILRHNFDSWEFAGERLWRLTQVGREM